MSKKYSLLLYLLILIATLFGDRSDLKNLRSASEPDYPPFCIVNEDGTAGGFSVELLKAACEAMDIDISFKVDEWNIIKQELADGKLDVLPLVGRTPERENLYDFTFPYMIYHGAVFARTGEERFKTRDDLKNAKLMVLKGDNAEEFARRVKLTSDIETVESFDTAFKNLSEGKCDFVITQKVMGLNLLNQSGITNIVPLDIDINDFQQNFCFAVTEGDKDLLELINEGLSVVIANGTFDRLHWKWFEPKTEIGKTSLVFACDRNYPPFSFNDDNGKYSGPDVDISYALAGELGFILDLRPEKWSLLLENFRNGEYDAIMGILYSEERVKYMDFSIPYMVSEYRIFAAKGTEIPFGISKLKNKKVAVEKSNIMHEKALEAGLEKEIILTDSHEEALLKLSSGEADYALLSYLTAIYYINKNSIQNVYSGDHYLHKAEFCYAVKKGNIVLLNNINNAIANLSASGKIRKIQSKWFVAPVKEVNYGKIIKYAAAIIVPLLIILFGIIFWNRSLKRQVEKKTEELAETEYIFTQFMENSPIYVFFKDKDIRSLRLSKNFEKMLGKPLSEILHKNMEEIFPSEFAKKMVEDDIKILKEGKLIEIEEDFNGRHYTTIKFPIYDNGEPKYLAGYTIDVTDKMNSQLLVAESEEKYRQIFESASEGIFMTKPDGTILSANPEACKILGRTEKEIIELGRDKLFDTEDPEFIESLDIRSKKGSFKGEITAIGKDGTKIPLMLTSNVYHDSNGEEKSITIFSDITERKQDENKIQAYLTELEKSKYAILNVLKDVNLEVSQRKIAQDDLKKLNVELEEKVKERTFLLESANKELEAFSYSVSHDLKAPLRAIMGFTNILKEDHCNNIDDEGLRYLNKINNNTSKMQKLIDDLLEFSRVGRSSIRPQNIQTVKMLYEIFKELKSSESGRIFDFTVDPAIPDITADSMLVTQLFRNIIGNAIKFTSKKEVSEIKINYKTDEIFHIISIKDNGSGFDEKYKSKIFEVFQRLHSSEDFPGTGVGMSIVYKIATKHGWSLDAESKNGNGAMFYIKIPIEDKKEVYYG